MAPHAPPLDPPLTSMKTANEVLIREVPLYTGLTGYAVPTQDSLDSLYNNYYLSNLEKCKMKSIMWSVYNKQRK